MIRNSLVLITGFFLISVMAFSQDTLILLKNDILQKVTGANLRLKISEMEFESSRADYRQSNALFLPDISLSHTFTSTTNPLMAIGSKLNQEKLIASDFNPSLLNNPAKVDNAATRIDVRQPILNLDGIKERQAAKSKSEAYSLQAERTKEYMMLEALKAYIQLQLSYKTVEVIEKANSAGRKSLKLMEDYFNQGMVQKTDLLNMQVRMSELTGQLQYAKSNVQNASDYLASLFNESPNKNTYKPSEKLDENIEILNITSTLSEKRKDFQAMNKFLDAYQNNMQAGKMKFLPRVNAFGSYELYGSKAFDTGANGYLIGASLSWNIFDGYKSIGKMEKARADFRKGEAEIEQYKLQSKLEFYKTVRQLKDAENKVNLSKEAFDLSKEAYRIRQNRFEQGIEKTNDLLLSESLMLQKELEFLQAVFEYNFIKQYIQFLSI